MIKNCNCSDWYFVSIYDKYESCEDDTCANEFFFKNLTANNFDYIRDFCLPECPLECYETLYKTSATSFQLIGEHFKQFIQNNGRLSSDFINRTIDATSARESVVKLNIYYDSLSYTETIEAPQMDIISLLASIGGNLSLFLGLSVFSLFELIEVLLMIVYFKFYKRDKKIWNGGRI